MATQSLEQTTAAARLASIRLALWCDQMFGDDAHHALLGLGDAQDDAFADEELETQLMHATQTAKHTLPLVGLCATLHEFAWGGTFPGSDTEISEHIHESAVLMDMLENGHAFLMHSGEEPFDASAAHVEALLNVCRAARCRWALHEGFDCSIREIATLAGVSEKTVRMAANPKKEGHLVTHSESGRTLIRPEHALDWLRRRNDFRETRYHVAPHASLNFRSAATLGADIQRLREGLGLTPETLCAQIDAGPAERIAYRGLEEGSIHLDNPLFETRRLVELGRCLALEDVRSFVSGMSSLLVQERSERELHRRMHELEEAFA